MFQKARIKLTAWYLLVIMLVSISFSFVVYGILTNEVERFDRIQRVRFEHANPGVFPFLPDHDLVDEFKGRIALILISINTLILVLSGLLGYFLAGRTLKPIKRMVEEQNRFISDASHELRTPLTALKSSMEVFLRDKRPNLEEAKTLIGSSIEDVDKLKALSDSLLQLTQYGKVNGNLKFEKLSISQLVITALGKVSAIAKTKKVRIENKCTDIEIEGNIYSLTDMLVIFLDNAIKYSKVGGSVEITSEKSDGLVKIRIKDTGIGISETDLLHIFERFYRADKSRSESGTPGYGLGLSIAKRIVDIHRGSIAVQSKVAEGSTFTISIPIKRSGDFQLGNIDS